MWVLRASSEPCVDAHKKARWELAHKRDFLWADTYGERRDSERKARSAFANRRHGELLTGTDLRESVGT